MYRVMIVDDEMLARIGVISLIQWEKNNMTVVGEAENGKKALQLAMKLEPDIIITDIKMPIMNGIDLIKTLQSKGFKGRFIVLSSYSEFEYVKEAMKLGVEDYILKLKMEPDELLEVLRHVMEKIKKEKASQWDQSDIEKYLDMSIPIMQEDFIKHLVLGQVPSKEEIKQQMALLQLKLPSRNLVCMTIRVESYMMDKKYSEDDHYILDSSIINLIRNSIHMKQDTYACKTDEKEYTVLASIENGQQLEGLINSVKEALRKYINLQILVGISKNHSDYNQIHKAYRESKNALDRAFNSNDGICYYDQKMIQRKKDDFSSIEVGLKDFEKAYSEMIKEDIQTSLAKLMDSVTSSKNLSREQLKGICSSFVYIIKSLSETTQIYVDHIWHGQDPYKTIESLFLLEDFMHWIQNVQEEITSVLDAMDKKSQLVINAKRYIQQHYHIPDISLGQVADHLHISSNYLSILFKEQAGICYNDYITNVRLEQAKVLLRTSHKKIYRIADEIGYGNIHYFSRIFKKITGLTPLQFRNSHKQ